MKKYSKVARVFAVIWVAIIFYFLGYLIGHKNIVFEQTYKPKVVNMELGKPKDINFSMFWDAWNKVTEKYVGKYDTQKMVYGAIKGMVEALGDPYSQFMEATTNKQLQEDLSGEIQGIGAELTMKDGKLTVVAPLDDSPAKNAGLKAQDEIIKIDGQSTAEMTLDDAISKIRGKAGTEVTLLINRADFKEPQEFKIKRDIIVIKSVKWEMKDNVAYIQISQFGDDTSALIKQAADEIVTKNPKAIVLDLRDNPGGYLDAAVDVASLFMNRGVVVKEQDKAGKIDELTTTLEGKLAKYKVIVLINEGSASASEIVAGALRDNRGATVIGKTSFGKGSVQEIEPMANNTALRITIAKWLTPKGIVIDKTGIKPDIIIDLSAEDFAADRDPQLDRALQEANK